MKVGGSRTGMKEQSLKIKIIKTLWRILIILIGSAITATGITFLIQQHKLLTGGVTGISLLLSYFTPIEPGIFVLVINIPLFIIAWRKIDLHFSLYSILGTTALSIGMIVFSKFQVNTIVEDPLLAALFGGMLSGGGTGLVIRARGSHGGTDIISIMVRRKFSVSIGMVNFYLNLIIVAVLALKFGIELGLLTIFAQFVSAKALDRMVTGFNTAKAVTIISDNSEEIADYIKTRMYRGVTFLEGQGGYGRRPKKVIWCVVTTSQLSRVKGAMKRIDPGAFMAITDASEIVGRGFHNQPF